jgi:hypothetical protein
VSPQLVRYPSSFVVLFLVNIITIVGARGARHGDDEALFFGSLRAFKHSQLDDWHSMRDRQCSPSLQPTEERQRE